MSLNTSAVEYVFDKASLYQLFATLLVYISIRLLLSIRTRRRRYKLFKFYGIPGPEANIIDGHDRLYKQNVASHIVDDEFRATYGKTYGVFIGDEPRLISTDLELLRHVFLENLDSFKARMDWPMKGPLTDSILIAPYERWKMMRKVMSPAFSSYKMRGSESVQFIEDTIKLMLAYIEEKFSYNQKEDENKIELDILDLMKAAALHMISRMAVPLPNVQVLEKEKNVQALDEFVEKGSGPVIDLIVRYPFLRGPIELVVNYFELDKILALISCALNKTIERRLGLLRARNSAKIHETSLIELLIRLHHEGRLTKEEVISNCLAVLMAGYDTTSTTLTYILWALAKHKDVQEKLRADVMTYGCDSLYLDQVIDETMRLYPTVILFTSRKATKTTKFSGLTIPQGTRVVLNTWLIHRDPETWPDPLKFDPERFRPGVEIHPCAFAPFGLGARKCLGYQLARLEIKMVVCDIILRYKLELISPDELDLITYAFFLSKPKEKVSIGLERL